ATNGMLPFSFLAVNIFQIIFEEGVRVVVEFKEIRNTRMAWEGGVVVRWTTYIIAPNQNVTQSHVAGLHGLQQRFRPPCRIRYRLQSCFREGREFACLYCIVGNDFQFMGCPGNVMPVTAQVAVVVHTYHVYPLIPGVPFEKFFARIEPVVGGECIQEVVHTQAVAKVGNGKLPQGNKLLPRAMGFTPPEPAAVEFMVRSENYRHELPVRAFDTVRPFADAIEYLFVFVMRFT